MVARSICQAPACTPLEMVLSPITCCEALQMNLCLTFVSLKLLGERPPPFTLILVSVTAVDSKAGQLNWIMGEMKVQIRLQVNIFVTKFL